MGENQQSLIGKIRERRALNKQAEQAGNSLVGEITQRIIVNMGDLIPAISPEAKNQVMSAFFGTDQKIQPSSDKVWKAVDTTMDWLNTINPELADMIETYDADQRDERPVAYFFTMFMAVMTHESTQKTGK